MLKESLPFSETFMENRSLAIGAGYVSMHVGVTRIILLAGYTLLFLKCLLFNNIN